MSEEQLAALIVKLKDDTGLKEKLKGAGDLDAAVSMAQEAGFDVVKADWLKYQAKQALALSDDELEAVAGGLNSAKCITPSAASCGVVGGTAIGGVCVDGPPPF